MTGISPPSGLFETHLTVADLGRSVAFYRDVVGLEPAFEMPDGGAAFLWVGGRGRSMLGLWVERAPLSLSLHVAFRTSVEDVLGVCSRLRSAGVTPLSFFATEADEPSVIGWMPAAALYFRDPDGHLLEYLAMLDEPPQPDLGVIPWSQWTRQRVQDASVDPYPIRWHRGAHSELRDLFELADDSSGQIDHYIDRGRVLVATDGRGEVVGHLQLLPGTPADSMEIKSIAVQERFRSRGIGRRLVERALAVCRAEGARVVSVTTAMADVDSLRFYQRRGFRVASIEPDAFTPETGYRPAAAVDGIPLRDAVRFELALDRG